MRRVALLPAAEIELEKGVDWYHQRDPRAARRFRQAIDQAIDAVAENPQSYPFIDDAHQAYVLTKYPWLVVYRYYCISDFVLVVAVAHGSQEEGYWRGRSPDQLDDT
jgi:plasmid stabilization system protein ParE